MKVSIEDLYLLRHDSQTTSLAVLEMKNNLIRAASFRRKALAEDRDDGEKKRKILETDRSSQASEILNDRETKTSLSTDSFVVEGMTPLYQQTLPTTLQLTEPSRVSPTKANLTEDDKILRASFKLQLNTPLVNKSSEINSLLTSGIKLDLISNPSSVFTHGEVCYNGNTTDLLYPSTYNIEMSTPWWRYTNINQNMHSNQCYPDFSYYYPQEGIEDCNPNAPINPYSLSYNYFMHNYSMPQHVYDGYDYRSDKIFNPYQYYDVSSSATGSYPGANSGFTSPYINPELFNYWASCRETIEEEEIEIDPFDSDSPPQCHQANFTSPSSYNQRLGSLSTQTDDVESYSSDSNNISIKIPSAF